MDTRIFHKIEYDLKGHGRSHMALLAKFVLVIHISTDFDNKFVEYYYYEKIKVWLLRSHKITCVLYIERLGWFPDDIAYVIMETFVLVFLIYQSDGISKFQYIGT